MMDKKGTCLFANAIACHYIQQEVNDVIGKTIYHFFDTPTADFYVAKVRDVIKCGQQSFFEYEINILGKAVWLRNAIPCL